MSFQPGHDQQMDGDVRSGEVRKKSHLCSFSGVARIWCEGGGTKLQETFVAHKITRDNTLVHIAATELPQLLSQSTSMFGEV